MCILLITTEPGVPLVVKTDALDIAIPVGWCLFFSRTLATENWGFVVEKEVCGNQGLEKAASFPD